MYFPAAEITTNPLLPFVVALGISFCTSMGGVSGAILLLPFLMSGLGYTNPSVSATNQFFNIVACPGGVYRYYKEGRLLWPVSATIALGTLPGVFVGALLRITVLPDPSDFRLFAGCVLLYVGLRMVRTLLTEQAVKKQENRQASIRMEKADGAKIAFTYDQTLYTVSKRSLMLLSAVVGLVGGIYGIGGGAMMAPFLVSFFGLPVYVVAGATLLATAITSLGGVCFYTLLSTVYEGIQTAPDWRMGLCIGFGGMVGMYLGARCQKFVRAVVIKWMLALILLGTAIRYVL
ncbi:MAG: sulfite exporter TauE/SafE family protein [Desulfovibrio sp.]|nr:sulfite exporter TauE/SafE family protein [Desulfovibrio sp.]